MEPSNSSGVASNGQQSASGPSHVPAVPPGYTAAVQQTQHTHPNLVSLAAGAPQLDPNSLLMHPQTAAAVAAVAAAAAQQMVQAQAGAHNIHVHATSPAAATQQLLARTPTAQPPPAPPTAALSAGSAAATQVQAPLATPTTHAVQAAPTPPPQVYAPAVPQHLASLVGIPSHVQSTQATPTAQTAPRFAAVPTQPGPAQAIPQVQTTNPAVMAAAAAQVVAAHAAAASASSGAMANALLANMQNWKLEQLEAHVQWLREASQPIPQPVAMLLADARRKEEKKTAKRVANRRSACTSRARKKALVEEMTRTNARLKRQALILALLPDLVIAITIDGEITFCSAQVERVLKHKIDDLIGSKLEEILAPASRPALRNLVQELVDAERAANAVVVQEPGPNPPNAQRSGTQNDSKEDPVNGHASAQSSNGSRSSSNCAAVVSDQSFPLSVVKVQSPQSSGIEENSDLSTSNVGGKNPSAATNNSSPPPTHEGDITPQAGRSDGSAQNEPDKKAQKQGQPSSDDSFSLSSDAKNLRKANENLSRNVRWHNEKMLSKKAKTGSNKPRHKDDVTGASVTANNAGARLSSLQHRPKKPTQSRFESLEEHSSSSSDSLLAGVEETKKAQAKPAHENSDDSGYRESNESAREDTSSSASDSSNGRRGKPLAPTCNVCLIREDLSTIWCEVTSSIRTRSLKEESNDTNLPNQAKATNKGGSSIPAADGAACNAQESPSKDEVKELLLCLRPVRDGEEKVDESLRFVRSKEREMEAEGIITSTTGSSNITDSNSRESEEAKRPMKKRPLVEQSVASESGREPAQPSNKKKKKKSLSEDTEKSVVESLMLMSSKAQK